MSLGKEEKSPSHLNLSHNWYRAFQSGIVCESMGNFGSGSIPTQL